MKCWRLNKTAGADVDVVDDSEVCGEMMGRLHSVEQMNRRTDKRKKARVMKKQKVKCGWASVEKNKKQGCDVKVDAMKCLNEWQSCWQKQKKCLTHSSLKVDSELAHCTN